MQRHDQLISPPVRHPSIGVEQHLSLHKNTRHSPVRNLRCLQLAVDDVSGCGASVSAPPALARRTADGGWRMEDGGWRMEDGWRWTVDGGRWTVVDGGRWTVDGRRRSVDGGRRTAYGGQRTADDGRRTVDGGRRTAGRRWTVDGGRRTVDGGRRTAGRRWTVDGGRRAAVDGEAAVKRRALEATCLSPPGQTESVRKETDSGHVRRLPPVRH